MRAFVLGTGSSGNALLVEAEGHRVLVDAGVGPQKLGARLAALGVDLRPGGLDAVIATHHHGDHFGGVEKVARAYGAPVYLHSGIDAPRLRRKLPVREYRPGEPFCVGSLEIHAEPVPHDAPHVAVRIASRDYAIGVATDVGRPTSLLTSLLAACDVALLEANHCPELLAFGPYPPSLQRRIAGGLGHLSNGQAAELAASLAGSRVARIYLGHLSAANNTPERALETVASSAKRIRVSVLEHGAVTALDLARRAFQTSFAF
ncbi:MAG: MBL fold metallo-hydrolase [Deltaproteobacteria bacterium]|nr:MBL fold metallo-hydrolase [Deltaproteobacteria bacterium]